MNIIDNLSSKTHKEVIKDFIKQSDEIFIASPFLSMNVNTFLDELGIKKLKRITLVTILKSNDEEQIFKMQSIIKILNYCKQNHLEFKLFLNNRLHGKIYCFMKNHRFIASIISSANFTDNGMEKNLEWGIAITKQKDVCKLTDNVFFNPQNIYIKEDAFEEMIEKFEKFKSENAERLKKHTKFPLDLFSEVCIDIPEIENNVNYWLKPIGDNDNHVTDEWCFTDEIQELNFSNRKPSGVHKNDIVITYGVGCGYILSVFKVKSDEPYYASDEDVNDEPWKERWPWSVEAENLSIHFAKRCHEYKLKISDVKDDFLNHFPQACITASGSNSFGRFNFGGDKLKLNPMFAKYIIQQIFSLNY